ELEAPVAAAMLALRSRERVLLVRLRMQEHRKIAADRLVTGRDQYLRCRADDDPIAIRDGSSQELVANRAADAIDRYGVRRSDAFRHSRTLAADRKWRNVRTNAPRRARSQESVRQTPSVRLARDNRRTGYGSRQARDTKARSLRDPQVPLR